MDDTAKIPSPSWSSWAPRKWIGLIVSALVLGEAIWIAIVSLTRDVILPLMAMAMGGDNSSPLYLGKQEFNLPDLFTAVLQLCVAGLFAIILNAWMQKKPKAIKNKSQSLKPAIAQLARAPLKSAAAAQTSAPAVSQPRATNLPPPAAPVAPKDVGTPAEFKFSQPATVVPTKPQTPAAPAAAAPKPTPPKPASKPKEVYYNIVGERITPLDDETEDQTSEPQIEQ
jgi:hypothetical protein